MDDLLEGIIRHSEPKERDGDFRIDGLLHCGKCGYPKECRKTLLGRPRVVGCMCQCEMERETAARQEEQRLKANRKIEKLRSSGIADSKIRTMRFENAGDTKAVQIAKAYVEKWDMPEASSQNFGLMFSGPSGCGKTYAAGCLANALIDKGVPVLMTSFPKVLALPYEVRASAIRKLADAPLLVLDDFGVERQSTYSLETVYMVVDERYKAGTPLIITTNLQPEAMRGEVDIAHKRIYGRLLEMCVPVMIEGKDWRAENARKQLRKAAEMLQ